MITKFLSLNKISIRAQSDTEAIIFANLNAMILAGKKPKISFKDAKDMIIEIKSE